MGVIMKVRQQAYYAVRVVIYHASGGSAQRDYVRGNKRMGKAAFDAWALGDLLTLTQYGYESATDADPVTWTIEEIDAHTAQENRQYHHTTH